MAIYLLFNRNGNASGWVVNTANYFFSNFHPGSGKITLDKKIFPYVKIYKNNGIKYYVNDGNEWEYDEGKQSASLMAKEDAFLWNNRKTIYHNWLDYIPPKLVDKTSDYNQYTQERTDVTDSKRYEVDCTALYTIGAFQTIPDYFVNNKSFQVWVPYENINEPSTNNENKNGQYIFSKKIKYKTENSTIEKNIMQEWGSTPPIYPIVIYNSMNSQKVVEKVSKEFEVDYKNGCLTNIKIYETVKGGSAVQVANYSLNPQDIVLEYIRTTEEPSRSNTGKLYEIGGTEKYTLEFVYFDTDKVSVGTRIEQNWDAWVPTGWQVFLDTKITNKNSPEIGLYYSPSMDNSNRTIDLKFTGKKITRPIYPGVNAHYNNYIYEGSFEGLWKSVSCSLSFDLEADKDNLQTSDVRVINPTPIFQPDVTRYTYLSFAQGGYTNYYYDSRPENSTLHSWTSPAKLNFHGDLFYIGDSANTQTSGSLYIRPKKNTGSYSYLMSGGLYVNKNLYVPNGVNSLRGAVYLNPKSLSDITHREVLSGVNFALDFEVPLDSTTGRAYVIWRNGAYSKNHKTLFILKNKPYGEMGLINLDIARYKLVNGEYVESEKDLFNFYDGYAKGVVGVSLQANDKLVINKQPYFDNWVFENGTNEYYVGETPTPFIFLKNTKE